MLVLRTCAPDFKSRNDFLWPESGPIECLDWNPKPECGHGLHGLPWGEGYCSAFKEYLDIGGKALVVEVNDGDVVLLERGRKCKFPRGNVVFSGSLEDAIAYLLANGGAGKAIAHAQITVGDGGTATAGTRGTATAGDSGTIELAYYDWTGSRSRRKIGYIGEDGLLPHVKYRLNDAGLFVPVDQPIVSPPASSASPDSTPAVSV